MKRRTTIRLDVPTATADLALHRCRDFLLACAHDENVLESLILSCYLQGVWDGVHTVSRRPELLQECP